MNRKREQIENSKRMKNGKTKRRVSKKKRVLPAAQKVTKVLARMRAEGTSLRTAARDAHVSPRTVLKKAASALKKNKSKRYSVKTSDQVVRTLMIPTGGGPEEINVRGLKQASLLGSYWSGLHKYYETGKTAALRKFEGEYITAVGGKKYPLITDTEILDRLGSAGVVSFESLYARS